IVAIKFHEAQNEKWRTGQFPTIVNDTEYYRLISFMVGIVRAHQRLSARGRTRLRGMLLDGLKSDHGLLALENEIATALHLLSRGFDVEFHDIEEGSGVDFIARQGGVEIEVECKMISGDLGRKVHRHRAIALFGLLAEISKRTYSAATRGLLVRIALPDRL